MASVVELRGQGLNKSSRKWKIKLKNKLERFKSFLTLKIEVIFDDPFKSEYVKVK